MPRPEALRHSIPILFARKTVEQHPELVQAALRLTENNNQPKSSYLLQLGAAMKHDTFERLPQIALQTLVMTGTEDTLIDPGNSRLLSKHIPGAQLIEFEETGHLFFTEKPELVNSALVDFFEGT